MDLESVYCSNMRKRVPQKYIFLVIDLDNIDFWFNNQSNIMCRKNLGAINGSTYETHNV